MLSIDVGTFTATTTPVGETIAVVCAGECDLDALDRFDELLKNVHAAATDARAREVSLDLRAVSFMNSSCLSRLVAWVGRVTGMAPDARYRVRLRSDPKMSWQRRSLKAVQAFASDLITIDTD